MDRETESHREVVSMSLFGLMPTELLSLSQDFCRQTLGVWTSSMTTSIIGTLVDHRENVCKDSAYPFGLI